MNANKHNIFFYKDFVDDAGASVTADKAKYIFAVRFDLERKQVAINYPLGDLDGQSNYYKGKKTIDVMLEELNEASNLYNRVSDFENSHQVKLSEMLLNAYKNKTIQEDFSMLIL